jgi:hypothetical protein
MSCRVVCRLTQRLSQRSVGNTPCTTILRDSVLGSASGLIQQKREARIVSHRYEKLNGRSMHYTALLPWEQTKSRRFSAREEPTPGSTGGYQKRCVDFMLKLIERTLSHCGVGWSTGGEAAAPQATNLDYHAIVTTWTLVLTLRHRCPTLKSRVYRVPTPTTRRAELRRVDEGIIQETRLAH